MSNWACHAEFQPRHLKAVNEQIAVQRWQAVQQKDFLQKLKDFVMINHVSQFKKKNIWQKDGAWNVSVRTLFFKLVVLYRAISHTI